MLSNAKNVVVDPRMCAQNDCELNCHIQDCELCATCLSEKNAHDLQRAFREHRRRGGFKRVYPTENHFSDDVLARMSKNNRIIAKWFKSKCQKSNEWC